MTTIQIPVESEFGYVIALAILFLLQQQILFAIPVAFARKKYGVKPPTLYPNDAMIKSLKLSDDDVSKYNSVQRVHQNNVEFLVTFLPLFLLAGIFNPMQTSYAGIVVFVGRTINAIGYYHKPNARVFGGFFHLGEYYVVYLCGRFAYSLLNKT